MLKLTVRWFAPLLLVASLHAQAEGGDGLVFEGRDPVWGSTTTVVRRDGVYYMDGERMEELRLRNMPPDGLSLAMVNRIGRPSMYYLVLPRKLDLYVNCEHGACTYKRSIVGRCCAEPGGRKD